MTAQELFDRLVPRLNVAPPLTTNFLDAINQTTSIIANRLVNEWASDIVKEEATLTFPASTAYSSLPDGYIGMKIKPYIVGTRSELEQAAPGEARNYTTTGVPEKFEIVRDSMRVFPAPTVLTDIAIEYFFKPEDLVSMAEDLPFFGTMDTVFLDALLRIGNAGGFATMAPDFRYITSLVDDIARRRSVKTIRFRQFTRVGN